MLLVPHSLLFLFLFFLTSDICSFHNVLDFMRSKTFVEFFVNIFKNSLSFLNSSQVQKVDGAADFSSQPTLIRVEIV